MNLPGVHLVLQLISDMLFHVVPRWHATCLTLSRTELRYVTAPKGSLSTRLRRVANSVRESIHNLVGRSRKGSLNASAKQPPPGRGTPSGKEHAPGTLTTAGGRLIERDEASSHVAN